MCLYLHLYNLTYTDTAIDLFRQDKMTAYEITKDSAKGMLAGLKVPNAKKKPQKAYVVILLLFTPYP